MTGDEFNARYALLEQVAGEGARSFRATAAGGGEVMVHFMDGAETQPTLALLSALERLEPARRAVVREVATVDGRVAVVTDPIPGFRSLPSWIEAADSTGSGEFTRLFQVMNPSEAANPTPAPAPPTAPAPPAAQPSDFTRLFVVGKPFGAAAPPKTGAPGPAPLPTPAPPVKPEPSALSLGTAEGEFTRMFRAGQPFQATPTPMPPPEEGETNTRPAAGGGNGGADDPLPRLPPLAPNAAQPEGIPPSRGEADPFAAPPVREPEPLAAEGPGAYTRFFQQMDRPAWVTQPAASAGDAVPPSPRIGGEADDYGHPERPREPAPEPTRFPAPQAEAEARAEVTSRPSSTTSNPVSRPSTPLVAALAVLAAMAVLAIILVLLR